MVSSKSKQWHAREALRGKGQFWTPDWVADAMVAYASAGRDKVFDPAFGAGAFALAAQRESRKENRCIAVHGCELDPNVLDQARSAGVTDENLARVVLQDFLALTSIPKSAGIVGNPPYVRHHRLAAEHKKSLHEMAVRRLGVSLDGRAGIHAFFLIHALHLLEADAPLAFILPSDICEGVYAQRLWDWIAREIRIDAVVTFAAKATPFPGVDTNPVVLFLRKSPPKQGYVWARVEDAFPSELCGWVKGGFQLSHPLQSIRCEARNLEQARKYGVARAPQDLASGGRALGDYFRVMRGIATGANEFFFLTRRHILEAGLPSQFFLRAVGRTRDVPGMVLTYAQLDQLDAADRATFLLAINDTPFHALPAKLQAYLKEGESSGIAGRVLIQTRRPWYRMERRRPPAVLFSYLGRRNSRFIFNEADAVPLTGFLCVYPRFEARTSFSRVVDILNKEEVVNNLALVAKSYGSGALKVEPRKLEALPLPPEAVSLLENEILTLHKNDTSGALSLQREIWTEAIAR